MYKTFLINDDYEFESKMKNTVFFYNKVSSYNIYMTRRKQIYGSYKKI